MICTTQNEKRTLLHREYLHSKSYFAWPTSLREGPFIKIWSSTMMLFLQPDTGHPHIMLFNKKHWWKECICTILWSKQTAEKGELSFLMMHFQENTLCCVWHDANVLCAPVRALVTRTQWRHYVSVVTSLTNFYEWGQSVEKICNMILGSQAFVS